MPHFPIGPVRDESLHRAARRILRMLEEEEAQQRRATAAPVRGAPPWLPWEPQPGEEVGTNAHWPVARGYSDRFASHAPSAMAPLPRVPFGLLDAMLHPEILRPSRLPSVANRISRLVSFDLAQAVVPGPWCVLDGEEYRLPPFKHCVYTCPGGTKKVIWTTYGDDCPERVRSDDPRLREPLSEFPLLPPPVRGGRGPVGGGGGGHGGGR
jgi:hypothetical protein